MVAAIGAPAEASDQVRREWSRRAAVVILWAVIGTATVLGCAAASSESTLLQSRGPLAGLRSALTVPIAMTSSSDLRYYALPVGLAGVLVLLAVRPPTPIGHGTRWFEWTGIGILLTAILSCLVNGTWELSRGWVLWYASGFGWAVVVARLFAGQRELLMGLAGASVVALVGAATTLWHREAIGIRYLLWPIGPITISAALGAAWAAGAIGFAATRVCDARSVDRSVMVSVAWAMTVGGIAVAMVVIAGRIAAWGGLAAGVVWVGGLLVWRGNRRRGILLGIGVISMLVGGFLFQRSTGTRRDVGGSLSVRTYYWKAIGSAFPQSWMLGVGPDMFVARAATDLARTRSEMPRVLHGTVERSAHSEWLQAIYELGVPGGILYLALPLGSLIAAVRGFRRLPPGPRRAVLVAASAGLVAIVVCEAASINLRYGTMPAWYWTLMGLTLAASRSEAVATRLPAWAPRPHILRLAAGGVAAALLLVVVNDVIAGHAHARARTELSRGRAEDAADLLRIATGRLGAEQWLRTRFELGEALTAMPGEKAGRDAAVAVWQELAEVCPGYPGVGGRRAAALLNAGQTDDAWRSAQAFVDSYEPFDAATNLLLAERFETEPLTRIDRLRHALRSTAVDAEMQSDIASWLAASSAVREWERQVRLAERDVENSEPEEWNDPLAPETLRIEAARLAATGDLAGAARIQILAKRGYQGLADGNAPRRRSAEAEADASARAADLLFRSDPAQYAEAFRLAREAERLAVLGIGHEELRDPPANGDFIGDLVVPTEQPQWMRPIWRISAKLGMAVGATKNLILRILSSLPEDRWNATAVQVEQAELARELVKAFSGLPAERRPASYEWLVETAGGATKGQ